MNDKCKTCIFKLVHVREEPCVLCVENKQADEDVCDSQYRESGAKCEMCDGVISDDYTEFFPCCSEGCASAANSAAKADCMDETDVPATAKGSDGR